MSTLEAVISSANTISDEGLRANALNLIKAMTTERTSIGDKIIRWSPSQLRIVQGTTNTDNIDGKVTLGDIVLGSVPAANPLRVYILRSWDSRALWDQDLNRPNVICSSPDGKKGWKFGDCRSCENSKFQGDVPSLCRQQKTFLAITEDLTEIIRIDLSRTQLKIGAELEKRLSKMATMPFERVFELKSRRNEKNKNIYNLDPIRTDDYSPAETTGFLNTVFDLFAERRREELTSFYAKMEEYKAKKAHVETDIPAPSSQPEVKYDEPAAGEALPDYTM